MEFVDLFFIIIVELLVRRFNQYHVRKNYIETMVGPGLQKVGTVGTAGTGKQ